MNELCDEQQKESYSTGQRTSSISRIDRPKIGTVSKPAPAESSIKAEQIKLSKLITSPKNHFKKSQKANLKGVSGNKSYKVAGNQVPNLVIKPISLYSLICTGA